MDIGIRLGIEGEKQFKSALRDINQSFKVLGSEMQLVTSEFDKNDKSMQALAARKGVLNKEIEAQKGKIELLKDALANSAESFGENDKRTQNWQIQLNKAQAELNGMERELENNEKALGGMGDGMDGAGKSADGLGRELENTGEIAEDTGKRFEGLKGVLKGVGVAMCAAMAAIGASAVAAGRGLYNMATDAAEAGNNINQTSVQLGMSRQAVQEWDYVLQQNGASLYNLSYGMRRVQGAMGDIREDGGKVGKAISRLGLDFDEVRNKSPEDAMNAIVTAFQGMEEGADKTALALQIFGQRGGMALIPMLNSSTEATDELRQQAYALGMIMGDDALDSSVAFTNSMNTLSRTFGGVKMAIGSQLLPGLTTITDGLTDLIAGNEGAAESIKAGAKEIVNSISTVLPQLLGTLTSVVESIAEIAPEIISTLITGITDNLPMLIGAVSGILNALLQGISQALPALVEGALELVLALVEGILNNLPMLLEAAIQVVVTLVQGIAEALPRLIPAIVEAVVTMVQALIDNLPMILEAALQLIMGLADGLLAALPVLIAALPDIIIGIVEFLIDSIPMIIDAGIHLLTSLVEALPDIIAAIVEAIPKIIDGIITAVINAIPQIIDAGIRLLVSLIENLPTIIIEIVGAIPQIIAGIVNAVIGAIPQIIQAGIELFISLIQNLPQIIIELVKAVPQIIRGLIDAFMQAVSQFAEVGLNLVRGLWDGIRNAAAWIRDKVRGFIRDVLGGLARFLGINSPSRYMADMFGKNMAAGIGVGFDEEMDNVCKAMQDAIPTSLDGPDIELDGNINTALYGAGTAVTLDAIGYKLDGIASIMTQMFPALIDAMNIKVVLDDGTLVGRLTPEINRNLALFHKRNLGVI